MYNIELLLRIKNPYEILNKKSEARTHGSDKSGRSDFFSYNYAA